MYMYYAYDVAQKYLSCSLCFSPTAIGGALSRDQKYSLEMSVSSKYEYREILRVRFSGQYGKRAEITRRQTIEMRWIHDAPK